MDIKAQEIWNRITQLTEKRGYSQPQLCDKAGINFYTFRNMKSRLTMPDIKEGVDLAKVLYTTPEYLVYGNNNIQMDEDLKHVIDKLKELTPEQRKPIISIIDGQVDYWKNNS